jgi:archaeosine synthase beta-subunit
MDSRNAAPVRVYSAYPATGGSRDRFVLDLRLPRPPHDPWLYQTVHIEDERTHDGRAARTATVFLTGRECPWRCVMCDLWRFTTASDTPPGAVAAQVEAACEQLRPEPRPVTQIKLYNAGSFFDPRAVPEQDYDAVARAVGSFEEVIVESHPALIGPRVDRLLRALATHRAADGRTARLQVAMGLETAHPDALEQLHKRMSVGGFTEAAKHLAGRGVGLRVFLLVAPPFIPDREQDAWLLESVDVAFGCGASVVTLIPTREGNGAMEGLRSLGLFHQPRLQDIERSVELAHSRVSSRGRLFVDLWDLERFADCASCLDARRSRLHAMNLEQRVPAPIACEACAHHL